VKKQWITEGADLDQVKAQGKCIKRFVLIVERNVKFHLNHQKTDQFIAENVLERIKLSKFYFLIFL